MKLIQLQLVDVHRWENRWILLIDEKMPFFSVVEKDPEDQFFFCDMVLIKVSFLFSQEKRCSVHTAKSAKKVKFDLILKGRRHSKQAANSFVSLHIF